MASTLHVLFLFTGNLDSVREAAFAHRLEPGAVLLARRADGADPRLSLDRAGAADVNRGREAAPRDQRTTCRRAAGRSARAGPEPPSLAMLGLGAWPDRL